MTPRQAQLLAFIRGYIAENGYAPTYREMAVGIGMKATSKAVTYGMVQALIAQGKIIPARKLRSGRSVYQGIQIPGQFSAERGKAAVIVNISKKTGKFLSALKIGDVDIKVKELEDAGD